MFASKTIRAAWELWLDWWVPLALLVFGIAIVAVFQPVEPMPPHPLCYGFIEGAGADGKVALYPLLSRDLYAAVQACVDDHNLTCNIPLNPRGNPWDLSRQMELPVKMRGPMINGNGARIRPHSTDAGPVLAAPCQPGRWCTFPTCYVAACMVGKPQSECRTKAEAEEFCRQENLKAHPRGAPSTAGDTLHRFDALTLGPDTIHTPAPNGWVDNNGLGCLPENGCIPPTWVATTTAPSDDAWKSYRPECWNGHCGGGALELRAPSGAIICTIAEDGTLTIAEGHTGEEVIKWLLLAQQWQMKLEMERQQIIIKTLEKMDSDLAPKKKRKATPKPEVKP